MDKNRQVIEKFYSAFQEHDGELMAECYHPDVEFKDPAFDVLKGKERVTSMWKMLLERSKGELTIHFDKVMADDKTVTSNNIPSPEIVAY